MIQNVLGNIVHFAAIFRRKANVEYKLCGVFFVCQFLVHAVIKNLSLKNCRNTNTEYVKTNCYNQDSDE